VWNLNVQTTLSYVQIVVLSLPVMVELRIPSHVQQDRFVVTMAPQQLLTDALMSLTVPTLSFLSVLVMLLQHLPLTSQTHMILPNTLPVCLEMQLLNP